MLLMLALAMPTDAVAQDKSERRRARDSEKELIREIERGVYVKSNVGTTVVFPVTTGSGNYSGVVYLGLGVGGEFIDQERFSAAFEVQFSQGLLQGPRTDELTPDNSLTQGDVHMLMGTGALELSIYPSRRLGLGLRAGGGVAYLPFLMDLSDYNSVVAPQIGKAEGELPVVHQGPLPLVIGGPTLEYYTKLSHFSVGVDADFMFAIGFNPGVFASGFLKYTF